MATEPLKVEGLVELQAALRGFPAGVAREFRRDMRAAVEPARQAVEARMASEIPHMKPGSPWINARTGVAKSAVYIVPAQRGVRGRGKGGRPNFATLAMERAYEPSQVEAMPALVKAAEAAIARAARTVSG
jgi:hypothetical protein